MDTKTESGELVCTNQFAIFIIGAGGFGGKRSSPHVKVLFVANSQTASPIPKVTFLKPHSQILIPKILIPKASFPKPHSKNPHSQNLLFRQTSPVSMAPFSECTPNSKHLISELHSQFSELHFPTASSVLLLPFTAACT